VSEERFTQESLLCHVGFLEKGDVIRYEKRGKEMGAFFIGSEKGTNAVKVRKTEDSYDVIALEDIKEKVDDPEIREGFHVEEDLTPCPTSEGDSESE